MIIMYLRSNDIYLSRDYLNQIPDTTTMALGIQVIVLTLSLRYSCTDEVTEYSEGFVQLASERFSPKSMTHINHLLAYSMPIK